MRPELRLACEAISTPDAGALPALAPEGTDARRLQLEERAFWMGLDLAHNGVEARQCARYLELLDLVEAYNDAARSAAQARPTR